MKPSLSRQHPCEIKTSSLVLLCLTLLAAALPGSRVEGQTHIATNPSHDPDIAFNSVDGTWLVVWRKPSTIFAGAARIMGQRITSNGAALLGSAINISGEYDDTGRPRVAYDPVHNNWVVVWVAGADPIESGPPISVRARRVSSSGVALFNNYRDITTGAGEANAALFCGTIRDGFSGPRTPFALIVWEEVQAGRRGIYARNMQLDNSQPGGLRFLDNIFRLDTGGGIPTSHDSFRPRISRLAPTLSESRLFPLEPLIRHVPRVVFEVLREGQREVYVASVSVSRRTQITRVTSTSGTDETRPVVDWNPQSGRTLVLFQRDEEDGGVFGHYFTSAPIRPTDLNSFGPEFHVTEGGDAYLAAARFDDGFFVSASQNGVGLARIHGQRISDNPVGGFGGDSDQPCFAVSDLRTPYLAWRRSLGATVILGIRFASEVAQENRTPVADAGDDIEIVEGSPFQLDGSGSDDPDADPLFHLWTQQDGENLFVTSTERNKEKPQLEAPAIGPPFTPQTFTFELKVDDLRSNPTFPSNDTVTVTVVPGGDPNPPEADAGIDRTVAEDEVVQLNGSGEDPDLEDISFLWEVLSVTPPLGSVTLSGQNTPTPTFRTPRFANPDGLDIVLRLRVVSLRGGSDEDTVTMHVDDTVNEPPVAVARGAATVQEGVPFRLDATESEDPNGDELTFSWELTSQLFFFGDVREEVTIDDSASLEPEVTASIFEDRDLEFRVTVDDENMFEGRALRT